METSSYLLPIELKRLENCGYCHTCYSKLVMRSPSALLPQEEYCLYCKTFPDYASHTGRGGCCPDFRMATVRTRLRLAASPDVIRQLRLSAKYRP